MYRNAHENHEDVKFAKQSTLWVVAVTVALSVAGWMVSRVVSIGDTAVLRYEEYQEIYNTCQKIDADLATIRQVPDTDRMFESFSKAAMVAQKRQQMARWVEEYNAKSRMWNRALWKSSSLPHELSVRMFANYEGGQR